MKLLEHAEPELDGVVEPAVVTQVGAELAEEGEDATLILSLGPDMGHQAGDRGQQLIGIARLAQVELGEAAGFALLACQQLGAVGDAQGDQHLPLSLGTCGAEREGLRTRDQRADALGRDGAEHIDIDGLVRAGRKIAEPPQNDPLVTGAGHLVEVIALRDRLKVGARECVGRKKAAQLVLCLIDEALAVGDQPGALELVQRYQGAPPEGAFLGDTGGDKVAVFSVRHRSRRTAPVPAAACQGGQGRER